MRIGILADIHGHLENLRKAIDRLRGEQVDCVVALGDLIYDTSNADETVTMLRACDAVGVWGNHELGLCVDPDDEIRDLYSSSVMDFFATLKPWLEFGEVLFSHTFPSEDASDVSSYYLGQEPHEEGALDASFQRLPHRLMLSGHFHRWFVTTPDRAIAWTGEEALRLEPEIRYFFVIHAVAEGHAAVLDTERNLLAPVHL